VAFRSRLGIDGIHPAVFRKCVESLDCKREVKRSSCKEGKERAKSRTLSQECEGNGLRLASGRY